MLLAPSPSSLGVCASSAVSAANSLWVIVFALIFDFWGPICSTAQQIHQEQLKAELKLKEAGSKGPC